MTDPVSAGFAGFFLAMAIANVFAALLMRSRASLVYAALMLVMVVEESYQLSGKFGGGVAHALIIAAYLCGVVAFAVALLRVRHNDRSAGWITLAILAANLPLVFLEFILDRQWHFFAVDQIAFDALLAMLIVLGVRARRRERLIADLYLLGVLGPVIGSLINDLAEHNILPHWDPLIFMFDAGIAWEAIFFAYALALRNRGLQAERDRFERLAYVDGLTGVSNRRTFDETLERLWNVARRARVPLAVAMIDIDHFKRLNDTRGHQVGDECLRRVAALCSSALRRAGDCFARYGGEEFAAILVNTDTDHAIRLAEHMRRVVEDDGGMTISVGVASRVPTSTDDPLTLIADADSALYRAKNEGRNCVRVAPTRIVASGT